MNHSIQTQAMTSGTFVPPVFDARAFHAAGAATRADPRTPAPAEALGAPDERGDEALVAEVKKEAFRYCW